MVADAHRHGSLLSAGSALPVVRLRRCCCRGDLAAAEESAAGGRVRSSSAGAHSTRGDPAQPHAFRPRSLHERGRTDEARARCSSGSAPTIRRGTRRSGGWRPGRPAAGRGRAECGGRRGGGRARRAARRRSPTPGPSLAALAEGRGWLGRCDEAVALTLEELEITRAFGAPAPLGRTLRVLGTLTRRPRAPAARRPRCSRPRRRAWSTRRRWRRSAPRCGARGGRRTRASRCGARSSSPARAARTRSPRTSARSCTPRAPVPAATRSAASSR